MSGLHYWSTQENAAVEADAEAHLFRDHNLDEYVNAIIREVDASQYADG